MPWDADKTWRDVALDIVRGVTDRQHFDLTVLATNVTSTEKLLGEGTPALEAGSFHQMRIRAGGNSADDAAGGLGAHVVQIQGLRDDGVTWEIKSEFLTCAGTAASAPTTFSYSRVWLVGVRTSGTFSTGPSTGANIGDIVIEGTNGQEMVTMKAGKGTGSTGVFTVPDGFDAVVKTIQRQVTGNKPATLKLYRRDDGANDVGPEFGGLRLVREDFELDGVAPADIIPLGRIPPRVDLFWSAKAVASTTAASVTMEIVLYPRQEGQ